MDHKKYSNNPELDNFIRTKIEELLSGRHAEYQSFLKKESTGLLLAHASHKENRFRPGQTLFTYKSVELDGDEWKPVKETYGGGAAVLHDESVIARNAKPICYPNGEVVRGDYDHANNFIVDPEGDETLYNEYSFDLQYGIDNYAAVAYPDGWQWAYKTEPNYVFEIQGLAKGGPYEVLTGNTTIGDLYPGDVVIVTTRWRDGALKFRGLHACTKAWFNETYTPYK